jgi:hypothetical protein
MKAPFDSLLVAAVTRIANLNNTSSGDYWNEAQVIESPSLLHHNAENADIQPYPGTLNTCDYSFQGLTASEIEIKK